MGTILPFVKMHGLGNDFMIIESLTQPLPKHYASMISHWGDRRTGVGFDQLLLLEPPNDPDVDFNYRIFNADGSEVEQCGNGARCIAAFVRHHKLSPKTKLRLDSKGGILEAELLNIEHGEVVPIDKNIHVKILLPAANFSPSSLPIVEAGTGPNYKLPLVDNKTINVVGLSMGNPHLVIWLNKNDPPLSELAIDSIGEQLNQHINLPNGSNVEWVEVINREQIKIRVYERGVGETLACGTGACAAMIATRRFKQGNSRMQVNLPGGSLTIESKSDTEPTAMTGTTCYVYQGNILL